MKYSEIKSFEDACKALNIDATALPEVSALPEKHQKALIAHYKLVTIAQAANDGWEPDWTNWNEGKYYPWFKIVKQEDNTGFGLSYDDYDFARTYTHIGSRLVFKSREMAEYIGNTFKELYEAYFLI